MGSQDHFTCKTLKAEYPSCKTLKAEYSSCKTLKAEHPGFKTFKAKWRTSVGFQNFQSEVANKIKEIDLQCGRLNKIKRRWTF
ncbi:hypothetical protein L195_g062619, partial [Trifolium pratense]